MTTVRTMLKETAARLARFPWWCLVALTALCLTLEEWFPFSHFPMYSRNPEETSVLFVTDADGRVIHTGHEFGVVSSPLKKLYTRIVSDLKRSGELKHSRELSEAQRQAVAREVFAYLKRGKRRDGGPVPRIEGMRLHRRLYWLEDGAVRERTEFMGVDE